MARGLVFIISYRLAYDAIEVIDDDNLVTALSVQMQISIMLIGRVTQPSVEPVVLPSNGK